MLEYLKVGNEESERPGDPRPPVTRMLDEFLKNHVEGSKENLAIVAEAYKDKTKNELLNDELNHRYKQYDGRQALMQIERPGKPDVLVSKDLRGRPEKFSNPDREVKLEYASDGTIEKISIDRKQDQSSKYWNESQLIGFQAKGNGSYETLMKLKDGSIYASSTVENLRVSEDGTITYLQNNFGSREISISMNNSVTREERLSDTEQKLRDTSLPDGAQKLELTYRNGTTLTVLGKPTTIYQNEDKVFGYFGIAPEAALLKSPEGGKLVFLPNRDGTYLRAAFDPKGNFSADVIFDKPLPHYIDQLRNAKELKVDWAPFDYNSGVHFNLSGVRYGIKDNLDYYLNFKRDKGR